MSTVAVQNNVQRPNILSVEDDMNVLAAGQTQGTSLPAGIPARFRRFFRGFSAADSDVSLIDQKDLKNLQLTSGIPGKSEVEYQFLVEGKGQVTVKLECTKGGKRTKTIALK
jgi:hypothetical protein